jgi:integrase
MSTLGAPPRDQWPRHLWLRGNRFYARVRVPPSLGHSSSHLQRSLKTSVYAQAVSRLPVVSGQLVADIRAMALAGREAGEPITKFSVEAEAEWFRAEARRRGLRPGDPLPDDLDATLEYSIDQRLGAPLGDPVGAPGDEPEYEGEAEARRLADLVYGRILPVDSELERFITERGLRTRYAGRFRRATSRLKGWMNEEYGTDDARRVTRRIAGEFVDSLLAGGLTTTTANSLSGSLAVYWRWLHDRIGIEGANPWENQSRRQRAADLLANKRPFTDTEIETLLGGQTNRTLHDLMRVAALSGMRIEEIARLTVADTAGGVFSIREGKTAASIRDVPIHKDLVGLVARRTKDKASDVRLFDELRGTAKRELSAKASERFTDYRRDLGVDERLPKQRQSNVDFHSFRRWFATKAEQAGKPPHIISAVLGHAEGRGGMTLGVYSAGPAVKQKQAVVDSVRLPKGAPVESPEGPLMGQIRRRGPRPRAPSS